MKILSIDASTKSTGYGILDGLQLIEYNCITSASTDLFKRIHIMTDAIQKILQENTDISKIILEEVRPEEGLQNIKTHKALLYLQGSIAMMAHDNFPKIEIEYLYPNEWRKHCGIKTGSGVRRESLKPKDIAFVKDRYKITVNDDIADAIGIGYAYQVMQGDSDKIEWE
jgi:Holliday junction resolvasome RuvABC endonuclease subunit